ncbi:hypothetical protein DV735_g56, partial [Chaetothyriales sp. CBS 134920]
MADQPPAKSTRAAFKPRAGVQRRTKAEREAFAAEEAEREAKRAREAAAASAKAAKAARRPPGRKEDGAAGQKDSRVKLGDAGGVFGSATAERPSTRRALGVGSEEVVLGNANLATGSGLGAGGDRQYADSGSLGARSGQTKVLEDGIEIDDDPEEVRRDIETIWISNDEAEDEDADSAADKATLEAKMAQQDTGLRPLRAPSSAQTAKQEADRRGKPGGRRPLKQPATELTEVDERETDELEFIKEQPSSPESKRKTIKKPITKTKEVKPAYETSEERTERLRMASDVDLLRHTFAPADADGALSQDQDLQDGKLFLLQFPPLTPMLVHRTGDDDDTDGIADVQIKQEGGGGVGVKPPPTTADSKSKGPAMKKDPDAAAPSKDTHDHNGVLTACSPLEQLPSGLVGKLNVHASGRITLDWAGTDMEVQLGTDVAFLQDAPEQERSKAYALGQLDARMVVLPDWTKLYD